MALIKVEPAGLEFETEHGETVFAAATRHGLSWPTVCGGNGTCSTCFAVATGGAEELSEISPFEREGLARLDLPLPTIGVLRLACQATVLSGTVTFLKRGVRKKRSGK